MPEMVDFASLDAQRIPLVCVLGPTASGKTALAVELAERFDGEVVSADALAVYRGMDIGTAKPTPDERRGIRHHCIDCFEPEDGCDAQRWLDRAEAAVVAIHERGRLPILAGGTPLYFKLLIEGISAGPPKDTRIRSELERAYRADRQGLFAQLQQVDPVYAAERHVNDGKRIVRALEVYRISGRPYSSFHVTDGQRRSCWRTLLLGLYWPREELNHRINARTRSMFDRGLVAEVRRLQERLGKQAREGVGYKEVIGLLNGSYDEAHARYLVQRKTRHLAKHQMTWYRRFRDIVWLPGAAPDLVGRAVDLVRRFQAGEDPPPEAGQLGETGAQEQPGG